MGHQSTWQQLHAYLTSYYTWNGAHGIPDEAWGSLGITAIALAIAAVLALPLGVWLGHRRRRGGNAVISVVASVTRAVPTYGLLVLLAGFTVIGIGNRAAVIALAVFALAPLLTNAYVGVSEVDPDAIEAARGMGMSRQQVLRRVELPLAVPLIAAGVRTAVVQTFATATLAAFVGGGGLGQIISLGDGEATNGYGELIGGALAVGVLALILELLFGLVQALLTPGSRARGLVGRFPLPGSRVVLTG